MCPIAFTKNVSEKKWGSLHDFKTIYLKAIINIEFLKVPCDLTMIEEECKKSNPTDIKKIK